MKTSIYKVRNILRAYSVEAWVESRRLFIQGLNGLVIVNPRIPLSSELWRPYSSEYYEMAAFGYYTISSPFWRHQYSFACRSPADLVLKLVKHDIIVLTPVDIKSMHQLDFEFNTKHHEKDIETALPPIS